MKKLFGPIFVLVLMIFAYTFFFAIPAMAFEPGGTLRVEAGIEVGNDLSKVSVGDTQLKTEIRLDPFKLLRVEVVGTTGWTDGTYDKTLVVDEIGAYFMFARGGSLWFIDSADVGCGGKTSGLVDGNTRLSVEASNEYWLGCLTEISF